MNDLHTEVRALRPANASLTSTITAMQAEVPESRQIDRSLIAALGDAAVADVLRLFEMCENNIRAVMEDREERTNSNGTGLQTAKDAVKAALPDLWSEPTVLAIALSKVRARTLDLLRCTTPDAGITLPSFNYATANATVLRATSPAGLSLLDVRTLFFFSGIVLVKMQH